MLEISPPKDRFQIHQVRCLILDFTDWVRQCYPNQLVTINEYFGGSEFQAELADLPGKYAAPDGCLLLAQIDDQPAGCVAFRALDEDTCEMKRLFVSPQFQRQGIGSALTAVLIQEAQGRGYKTMRLDTGVFMLGAQRFYQALGFRYIHPYYSLSQSLAAGLVFMELDLRDRSLTQQPPANPAKCRQSAN